RCPASCDSTASPTAGKRSSWSAGNCCTGIRFLQKQKAPNAREVPPRRFSIARLETLPETRGRFQLNADLPIPFDGFGRMEIDLLCTDSRVLVEIDGGQHLADPVAYRRDRRKDQLLQENGYLVLRYLAEDLDKELDSVLDGTLRS